MRARTGRAASKAIRHKDRVRSQTENDVPQPQERAELGLMKLNPWRISVSS